MGLGSDQPRLCRRLWRQRDRSAPLRTAQEPRRRDRHARQRLLPLRRRRSSPSTTSPSPRRCASGDPPRSLSARERPLARASEPDLPAQPRLLRRPAPGSPTRSARTTASRRTRSTWSALGRNIDPSVRSATGACPASSSSASTGSASADAAVLAAFAAVASATRRRRSTWSAGTRRWTPTALPATGAWRSARPPTRARIRRAARLRHLLLMPPSTYEPFGIAYVDAGAAGVPSIGTTVGGARTRSATGGRGRPGDHEGLVAAMLDLADPQTARRLGERAQARSALFTWQAVAERLLRALRPRASSSTDWPDSSTRTPRRPRSRLAAQATSQPDRRRPGGPR